jgi:hypothetical protein
VLFQSPGGWPPISVVMKVPPRVLVSAVLAVIAGWAAFRSVPRPLPELLRTEFLVEIREGHVRKVVVEDHEVITGVSTTRGPFRTAFKKQSDQALVTELRSLGVEVEFEESTPGLI